MSLSTRSDTDFAPADRLDSQHLLEQFDELIGEGRITEVLDASPYIAMVTNVTRQIVFANSGLKEMLGLTDEEIRGKRPGELFVCPNANENIGGCGTSRNCRFCGIVHVLLESMGSGKKVEREARLLISHEEKSLPLDMKITSTPMTIGHDRFLMVFLEDISPIKKRERLERTFFHDVMNTASGLKNIAMYMAETGSASGDKATRLIIDQSDLLIEEIRSQQLLVDAESDNLAVTPIDTNALVLFAESRPAAEVLKEANRKTVKCESIGGDRPIRIDTVLTKRALLNALKNALEATAPGGEIFFRMKCDDTSVVFEICNDSVMPEEVRSQIFQRSFSTKGPGRGIGTYSLRLIVEHYLGGKVSFSSRDGEGTIFRISLPFSGSES